jgi:hypothetical protein
VATSSTSGIGPSRCPAATTDASHRARRAVARTSTRPVPTRSASSTAPANPTPGAVSTRSIVDHGERPDERRSAEVPPAPSGSGVRGVGPQRDPGRARMSAGRVEVAGVRLAAMTMRCRHGVPAPWGRSALPSAGPTAGGAVGGRATTSSRDAGVRRPAAGVRPARRVTTPPAKKSASRRLSTTSARLRRGRATGVWSDAAQGLRMADPSAVGGAWLVRGEPAGSRSADRDRSRRPAAPFPGPGGAALDRGRRRRRGPQRTGGSPARVECGTGAVSEAGVSGTKRGRDARLRLCRGAPTESYAAEACPRPRLDAPGPSRAAPSGCTRGQYRRLMSRPAASRLGRGGRGRRCGRLQLIPQGRTSVSNVHLGDRSAPRERVMVHRSDTRGDAHIARVRCRLTPRDRLGLYRQTHLSAPPGSRARPTAAFVTTRHDVSRETGPRICPPPPAERRHRGDTPPHPVVQTCGPSRMPAPLPAFNRTSRSGQEDPVEVPAGRPRLPAERPPAGAVCAAAGDDTCVPRRWSLAVPGRPSGIELGPGSRSGCGSP